MQSFHSFVCLFVCLFICLLVFYYLICLSPVYVITYVICSRLGGLILASLYLLVHKQIFNPAVNNDAVPPLADQFPGSNLLSRVLPHEQYFKGTKFESQGRATMIASKYSRSTVQAITVLSDRPSFHVTTLVLSQGR